MRILTACADHSRILLILGLMAGIGLPRLAQAMAPYLPQMVIILLVLTAFRIGARDALGALSDLKWSIPAVGVLQIGLPLLLVLMFSLAGVAQSPLAFAMILATSAPAISGGASLAIILKQDPARMMQVLIVGTALFPMTVLAVLTIHPTIGDPTLLFSVGLQTLATIVGAASVGFLLRRWIAPHPTRDQTRAMDGATVLFFAVIVVGLMAALGPVLGENPAKAALWALAAFTLSFGVQAITLALLSKGPLASIAGPLALSAGNRNIALFLVALPADIIAPIMIFVACWQLPMYLTPILLPRLYARYT